MRRRRASSNGLDPLDRLRALVLMADALRDGSTSHRRIPQPPSAVRPTTRRADASFEIQALVRKNLLCCTLHGFIDAERAKALLIQIRQAPLRLRQGFDVIFDVSSLGTVTPAAQSALRRVAAELVEAGMRQMVRVVGSAPGAAAAVARATEGLYQARVVASMAEAQRLLGRESGSVPGP